MAATRHRSVESVRMQIFPLIMSMIIFVLILRLAWIQIVQRQKFIVSAENQHRLTKTLEPERGKIFDRNGRLLAFNLPSVTIVANADSIKDAYKVGARLAAVTGSRADEMIAKLKAGKGWIEMAHKQPMDVKSKLQRLKLDHVGFRDDLQRRYPQGAIGAQVVGFARSDNSGGYGIELKWDDLLRGKPGAAIMQKTGRARLFSSPHYPIRKAVNGADLVLTIDERYQRIAQEELFKTVDEHNARGGSVVIMNPASGEILAMASAPGFNPNSYADYSDASWKLAAITDQFEPGSTFKLVSLAAMLDTGYKTETDKVFCENGAWRVMGETIEDTKRFGILSVRDVLVYSSNIGMAKMGRDFDKRYMYTYAEKFGFGQVSGIELDGEIGGILKSIRDWTAFTPLVFAFGHEVAVTALQMTCMLSTIANDGVYVSPRLLLGISNDGEYGYPKIDKDMHRVISPTTAVLLRDFMADVVKRGTGTLAQIDGITVCGKTGTAHMVREGGKGYSGDRYISSFGGFFPQQRPRLTLFVVIKEPRGSYYGGSVAAPCFKRIAERLISLEGKQYFQDETTVQLMAAEQERMMPNLVGLRKSDAQHTLKRQDLKVDIEGAGEWVLAQHPAAGSIIPIKTKVQLTAGEIASTENQVKVPRCTNLPLRNALSLLTEQHLRVVVSGNGQVIKQSPPPGKVVPRGQTVKLICEATI